jgi:hypothetical protein
MSKRYHGVEIQRKDNNQTELTEPKASQKKILTKITLSFVDMTRITT